MSDYLTIFPASKTKKMKNTSFILLLSLLLLLPVAPIAAQPAVTTLPEAAGLSIDRLERFSKYLETEIEAGRQPGAVVMIARRGALVHEKAYGYSDLTDRSPMQTDQIFYIQSMTKPIMAVAFMMLYEEGHFFLTDPISKYLPQFKTPRVAKDPQAGAAGETEPANKEITIAHVLSHTAGFSHGLGQSQLDRDYAKALYVQEHQTISDRVNALAELPLVGHPGEQWYYSAAPDVLAVLIEHFSGQPVAEFLRERLFDPLGMDDTGYNLTKDQQARMVSLHAKHPTGMLIKSPRQMPMEGNTVHGGTHALFSTAGDYMKFCQMLLDGGQANGRQFLSPKTIELMTMNHVGDLYNGPGQGFGLGLGVTTNVADSKANGSVGQYYWSGAYNTHFFIDPQEELIAIIMTQTASYSSLLGDKLRQFVYQAIVD